MIVFFSFIHLILANLEVDSGISFHNKKSSMSIKKIMYLDFVILMNFIDNTDKFYLIFMLEKFLRTEVGHST